MPPRPPAALLTGLLLFAIAVFGIAARPVIAAPFIDSAGRRVMLPDRPTRILPVERSAEVLVYVLAPDKLAGLERLSGPGAGPSGGVRPPVLRFGPDATPESVAAAAREYRADLIVDAGPVTPERAAFADAVQQRSGVPYILVYDGFNRLQQTLITLGHIFGVRERADDLRLFAEYDITRLRGRELIQSSDSRPRVYYAMGPDGLTTALPGSPSGAAIDEAGGINVAGKLGRGTLARISREQLLDWNPDIILVADRRFYDALLRDRAWRGLSAVREQKVYLEPNEPFGWIDNPPGINRLIGLYWLSSLFYRGELRQELRPVTCEFYEKFYHRRLTNAQLDALLRTAGEPTPGPAAATRGRRVPGLGAAPPSAPGGVPIVPGADLGVPGGSAGVDLPVFAEQPDALCTIPGVSTPITNTPPLPGGPGLPAPPVGRMRQPGTGGLSNSPPAGLPVLPGSPAAPSP
jgi:iron complex transport system substrate-binding protein